MNFFWNCDLSWRSECEPKLSVKRAGHLDLTGKPKVENGWAHSSFDLVVGCKRMFATLHSVLGEQCSFSCLVNSQGGRWNWLRPEESQEENSGRSGDEAPGLSCHSTVVGSTFQKPGSVGWLIGVLVAGLMQMQMQLNRRVKQIEHIVLLDLSGMNRMGHACRDAVYMYGLRLIVDSSGIGRQISLVPR